MKRRFITTLALLTLTASAIFAQAPPPRTPPTPAQMVARHVERLTAALTLTPPQQAQATTIFTTEQTIMTGLHASFDTAHAALKTAVEANSTAGINSNANQLGNLTTQQVIAQATAQAALYAILTADQKTKFAAAGPGFGPGGPGGPGGRSGPGGPRGFGHDR